MLSNKNISQEYIEASVLDHVAEKMLLSCNCNLDTAINLGVSSLLFSTIKERIEYFINQGINSFVLGNTDTWPNMEDTDQYSDFIDYLKSKSNIFFIIQTIGYDTKRHSNNVVEVGLVYYNEFEYQPIEKTGKRDYTFSCLNHYPKYFRIHLGLELWKNNLLDDILFSQSLESADYLSKANKVLKHLDQYEDYINTLPIKYEFDSVITPLDDKNLNFNVFSVNHTAFNNTYAHIYTESEIDKQVCTEKSIKPYLAGQIPIPLTPPGHLQYLKELGFYTFDDLLGTNYDQLNYEDKIDVIISIVSKGKDYIEDYYIKNYDEIEKNNINLQNMYNKGLTRLRKVL
jgi:hypothetical protein